MRVEALDPKAVTNFDTRYARYCLFVKTDHDSLKGAL